MAYTASSAFYPSYTDVFVTVAILFSYIHEVSVLYYTLETAKVMNS